MRLGGPQGRSRQVRTISSPPRFDPRTVQPVACRYTDYANPLTPVHVQLCKWCFHKSNLPTLVLLIFTRLSMQVDLQIDVRGGNPKQTRFFHGRLIYLKKYKKIISRLQSTLHWMICTYPISVSTVRNISGTLQLGCCSALLSKVR